MQENTRSGRLAAFQIPVRLLRVLERVFLIHRNFDGAAPHDFEQAVRNLEQVLAFGRIGGQRGTRGEQRAFRLQNIDVEGVDRSG